MKVLVFGSRRWLSQAPIERVLRLLPSNTVLIHGDAQGADRIAGHIAELLGFKVRKYPAQWEQHGRAAGPKRNQGMIDSEHPSEDGSYIDKAFGFHEDPDLGKGTKDMKIRLDKAQPIIVVEIFISRAR